MLLVSPFTAEFGGLDSNRITGKGVSAKTIQEIIERCESTLTYDEQSQSVKAEVTITESSGNFTVGGDFCSPAWKICYLVRKRSILSS